MILLVLIIAAILAAIFAIVRYAKRRGAASLVTAGSAAATPAAPLSGVGGWLLLLIVGLMVVNPLLGAANVATTFRDSEVMHPELVEYGPYRTFKNVAWTGFLITAAIGFYGGLLLARRRDPTAVSRAIVVLWLVGPGSVVLMGAVIPLALGAGALAQNFFGFLLGSGVVAAVWTFYLVHSERVRSTYGWGTARDE